MSSEFVRTVSETDVVAYNSGRIDCQGHSTIGVQVKVTTAGLTPTLRLSWELDFTSGEVGLDTYDLTSGEGFFIAVPVKSKYLTVYQDNGGAVVGDLLLTVYLNANGVGIGSLLKNVGSGAKVYIDDGSYTMRTLVSGDGTVTITQNAEEIDFSVSGTAITEGPGISYNSYGGVGSNVITAGLDCGTGAGSIILTDVYSGSNKKIAGLNEIILGSNNAALDPATARVAIGSNNTSVSNAYSVMIGTDLTEGNGSRSVIIGYQTEATGSGVSAGRCVLIGNEVVVNANRVVGIGYLNDISGTAAVVVGNENTCGRDGGGINDGRDRVIVGRNNDCVGQTSYQIIVGSTNACTDNEKGVMIGYGNTMTATSAETILIGSGNTAGVYSECVGIGKGIHLNGDKSVAIGSGVSTNNGGESVAIGNNSSTHFAGSIAIGGYATCGLTDSEPGICIGHNSFTASTSPFTSSVVCGSNSSCNGNSSSIFGSYTTTVGSNNTCVGCKNGTIGGGDSCYLGTELTCTAGNRCVIIGNRNHCEADSNTIIGVDSTAGTFNDVTSVGTGATAGNNEQILLGSGVDGTTGGGVLGRLYIKGEAKHSSAGVFANDFMAINLNGTNWKIPLYPL